VTLFGTVSAGGVLVTVGGVVVTVGVALNPVGPVGPVAGTTGVVAGAVSVVVPVIVESSLVSETNAMIRAMIAASASAPISATGSRQFGSGARRVRAGAPQTRHQSCSGPIVALQRGQGIVRGAGGWAGGAGVLTGRRCRDPAAGPGRRPSSAARWRAAR